MTREEEEKQDSEAELGGAGKAIWLSCSGGGGGYREAIVGDIYVFPFETSTFDETQTQ